MINLHTIQSHDIADYLPHDAPMIFIDKVIEYQNDTLLSEITITPQSAYFDAALSGVPNYVGIEYMAQTIAALAGIEAKDRNDIIRVGFLLGSRKLQLHTPFYALDCTYHTRVRRLYQEETGLAVFECQILDHNKIIAEANINVFQPQESQDLPQDNTPNNSQDSQEIAQ
ncbi:hotdog family protein [uncultured Shewanella sp.]|uniref:hotdog family protein n=1 Tax=uncultured Shewanella sp. TaxID=173975 RepID=UPI00260F531C|nr:hotdog family protein [uncultured Shewanella sp.]